MQKNQELYDRYTTTSSLADVQNADSVLTWSKGYFRTNYADKLPQNKSANILEVGCGYGRYLAALSEMGYSNCYGIDLSHEQITYAKTVLQLANVEEADAFEWLAGKVSVYDCILGLDILEHFETNDLLKLGKLIFQALKPGGIVIFQVPNAMSPINPITYGDLTHVRAFTPQSMQQFLLLTGFQPLGYFELLPNLHGIASIVKRFLWCYFLNPLISSYVRLAHGIVFGGRIYTANFFTIAKRSDKN